MAKVRNESGVHSPYEQNVEATGTSVIFGIQDRVGALASALRPFDNLGITLRHIESRPAKRQPNSYEFILTTDLDSNDATLKEALAQLEENTKYVQVLRHGQRSSGQASVPWFPRKKKDLDELSITSRNALAELDLEPDHPGYDDQEYKDRRKYFIDIACNYKNGQKIPRVEYTQEEIALWGRIFGALKGLYKTHACKEFNYILPLLVENCGYKNESIPQLQDVSDFLKNCTGFTLRPMGRLLSSRDFLAGLAFRVFHSTQYIRHPSRPFYTPEPDIIHDLIGHVPLLADPMFARFSQEIGIASLGASDEWVERLATLYWFTGEVGVSRHRGQGQVRAFGAGLLSSFNELEYCLSDEPTIKEFDPSVTSLTKYPITEYQPVYFAIQTFEDAQEKLKTFATKIPKPFTLHYDAFTESVDLLETQEQLSTLAGNIKSQLSSLHDALNRITSREYYALNTGNLQA